VNNLYRVGLNCFKRILFVLIILYTVSCQSNKSERQTFKSPDLSAQLGPVASMDSIANHLIKVRKTVGTTRALALHYPDLSEDEAYKIQMTMLSKLEEQGERVAGWKMGGAKVTDASKPFKPLFGFMLASLEVKSGGVADHRQYVNGSPLVEAEVGFLIKKDLSGPVISRDDLLEAIGGVGGFSELISIRVRDAEGGTKAATAQAIADGLSNGGYVCPKTLRSLDEVNLSKIEAQVIINGQLKARGNSMGYRFIDAVLYLANTLPKYGRYLRAGDVVITGSLLDSPPAKIGDQVEITFSAFNPLNINST